MPGGACLRPGAVRVQGPGSRVQGPGLSCKVCSAYAALHKPGASGARQAGCRGPGALHPEPWTRPARWALAGWQAGPVAAAMPAGSRLQQAQEVSLVRLEGQAPRLAAAPAAPAACARCESHLLCPPRPPWSSWHQRRRHPAEGPCCWPCRGSRRRHGIRRGGGPVCSCSQLGP